MKIVVEQYSKSILAAMIGLLLLGMFTKIPFFNEIGMMVWQPNAEIEAGVSFDEFKNQKPSIIFLEDAYALKTGEAVEVSKVLSGKAWDGEPHSVCVKAIYSEDLKVVLSTESGTICIENAGIYWVLAEVKEKHGATTSVMAKLFVNER